MRMVTSVMPEEPSSWIGCCHTTFLLDKLYAGDTAPSFSIASRIENRGTSSTGPTSKSASQ